MTSLLDEVAIALERIVAERVLEARSDVTERWLPEFAKIEAERNAACAERDALRERAEAAEAKLLEVRGIVAAPQVPQWVAVPAGAPVKAGQLVALTPEEIDGFWVGDLVSAYACASEPIARFYQGFAQLDKAGLSVGAEYLARKPVEVGDTVRIVEGGHAGRIGRVDGIVCGEARVVTDPNASLGEALWVMLPRLVAVAP